MKPNNYYYSTPVATEDCPANPCVLVTDRRNWDAGRLEEDSELSRWMKRNGFGELMSNYYQADHPELRIPEAVMQLLSMKGMTHNPTLDSTLQEGLEL